MSSKHTDRQRESEQQAETETETERAYIDVCWSVAVSSVLGNCKWRGNNNNNNNKRGQQHEGRHRARESTGFTSDGVSLHVAVKAAASIEGQDCCR